MPAAATAVAKTPAQTLLQAQTEAAEAAAAVAQLQTLLASAQDGVAAMEQAHQPQLEERNSLRRQIEAIEAKMDLVHKTIAKYATVQDPVIANDGFTYERNVITSYISECRKSGAPARSNQADVVLTDDNLYSNSTLRRIVDQLRAVQMPPAPASAGLQAPAAAPAPASASSSTTTAPATTSQFRPNAPAFNAGAAATAAQRGPPAYAPAGANRGGIPAPASHHHQQHHPHHHQQHHSQYQPPHHQHYHQQQQQRPAAPAASAASASSTTTSGNASIPTFTVTNPNSVAARQLSGNTHPCMRVYGVCNFGDNCAYAKYPIECCLSNLKSRCRYGDSCHELHVEIANATANGTSSPPAPGAGAIGSGRKTEDTSSDNGGVNPSATPWAPGMFS